MTPRGKNSFYLQWLVSMGPMFALLRKEGKHPGPPEPLINYVKYAAKEGRSATFTAAQFTLYWILITLQLLSPSMAMVMADDLWFPV